ncbi:MAG TPA: benzoate-CoA ligase family protein [bacterium]|nr:benzoate-CoA ligase family protein [bacterium]
MSIALNLPNPFNVADYCIAPNLSPERRNRPYMLCGDEALTYGELDRQANRVGNALKALGVEPEQRVMLLMLDTLAFPPCFWGAVRIGAVAIPVNTLLKPPDYEYFLNDSRARVLIVDEALWPNIEPIAGKLRHLRHVVIANGKVPGKLTLAERMAEASDELESEPMSPDDPAFWLYTSGSTGAPKAAVHLHHDIPYVLETYVKDVLALTPEDRTFSAAKFFFAYGLGNSLYFQMPAGACGIVVPGRPTPELMFETIEKYRPTVFYGVPTLYNGMLHTYEAWQAGKNNPPNPLPTLNSLRFSVSAGESLPADLFQRWSRYFGSEILDGIGSTEMLHIFISNRLGDVRPGSTGKPVPGYEARLVDENSQDVGPDQIGALLVKGDSAAAFYWNKHAKTQATMLGEWMVTGDNYHRDGDGYFWYDGRNDDMMKVSGSWVSPIEVEAALITHEAVAECAVVGNVDSSGLTKTKAFVVLKQGEQASDELAAALAAHVKAKIAGFKAPSWVQFVSDLPKTATGKIKRFELRG